MARTRERIRESSAALIGIGSEIQEGFEQSWRTRWGMGLNAKTGPGMGAAVSKFG